jgi:methyl-accepting chemotaxis protein
MRLGLLQHPRKGSAIESVNEFIASTAAAVEEQSIVTSDMACNMQRASAELAA